MPAPTLYLHAEIDGAPHNVECQFLDTTFALTRDGETCVAHTTEVLDLLVSDLASVAHSPRRTARFALIAQGEGFVRLCAIGQCENGAWSDLSHPLHPRRCTWDELRDEVITCLTAVMTTPWDAPDDSTAQDEDVIA